jgi:hypothetical protein
VGGRSSGTYKPQAGKDRKVIEAKSARGERSKESITEKEASEDDRCGQNCCRDHGDGPFRELRPLEPGTKGGCEHEVGAREDEHFQAAGYGLDDGHGTYY